MSVINGVVPQTGLSIRVEKDIRRRCIAIAAVYRQDGIVSALQPVSAEDFEKDYPRDDVAPFVRLPYEAAQELMDELWQCGIRPTDRDANQAEVVAVKNHISSLGEEVEFLRRVITHQLGIIS